MRKQGEEVECGGEEDRWNVERRVGGVKKWNVDGRGQSVNTETFL